MVKGVNNNVKFIVLLNFMCGLLVLVHSSISMETVFSKINIIKIKQIGSKLMHLQTDYVLCTC